MAYSLFVPYSSYENTQLKTILDQMRKAGTLDSTWQEWFDSVLKADIDQTRQVDMHNEWIVPGYYHPLMGGRTSIKVVLPAILSSGNISQDSAALLDKMGLLAWDANGGLSDPYSMLKAVAPGYPEVAEGTGAMRAYEEMIYGSADDDSYKLLEAALRKYCALDTLSMVIIWEYLNRYN